MTFQEYILTHLPIVLFGAKVALLWVLANYTYPADPAPEFRDGCKHCPQWRPQWLITVFLRSFALACIVTWISGWSFILGAFTLAIAILLPLVRSRIAPSYLAELEIGANLLFISGTMFLALLRAIPLTVSTGSQLASRQVAAVDIVLALVIFNLRGSTYIVRGVLDKGKTLPERTVPGTGKMGTRKETELDIAEYNRGRIIGNIERLLLMTFVAMQAYEALAFLITAKGLFRAKNLDQEAFAEYFLVGTLASSLIAVAAGLGIQFALRFLW
jgi:hypothetical protein